MEDFKKLTLVVYLCVAGVAVSFGGAIVTAVKNHNEEKEFISKQNPIPVPATAQ